MVRVAQYLLTAFLLLTLNFFLPRMMPGDPIAYLVGDPGADMPVLLTEEMRQNLLAYYDLDKPLGEQYTTYLANLARGDLGWSIAYNAPVGDVLLGRMKWTLLLVGTATVIYVTLGVALGALSAWRRGGRFDAGLLVAVIFTGAWPSFFLSMLLIIFFSVKLKLFPIAGAQDPALFRADGLTQAMDVLHHMILPLAALVLANLSGVYYLMRNSMLSVLGEDYIRTAQAKGLRERRVLWRHVLPNALLPVVTMVAMRLGFVITGAMFVEVVFAYPGMGTMLYEASTARDYPLLQGALLATMAFVLLANLSADLAYSRLDPRVRVK
jgi:peptide/nickel transport system permease protein